MECPRCGLFVFWQIVDGLETPFDMRPLERRELIAALLDRRPVYARIDLARQARTFIWVNPTRLARDLVAGEPAPANIHLGHAHRFGWSARRAGPAMRHDEVLGPPPF